MTNTEELLKAMARSGLKFKAIALQMGLTPNGLRKKVYNETEFRASEIQKCTEILKLTNSERDIIFLSA